MQARLARIARGVAPVIRRVFGTDIVVTP